MLKALLMFLVEEYHLDEKRHLSFRSLPLVILKNWNLWAFEITLMKDPFA